MRRKERRVTNPEKIRSIIKEHTVLRLGLCKDNMPYIVPMNFGCTEKEGKLYLYMHGAADGTKTEYIKANPNVCFEMDQNHKVVQAEKPHDWTAHYTSVIGFGKIKILQNAEEKLAGLGVLMQHCGYTGALNIPEKTLDKTCVFEIEVDTLSVKANPPITE